MERPDPARRRRRRGPAGILLVIILGLLAISRLTGGGRIVHESGRNGPLDGGTARDPVSISSIEIGQAVTMGSLVVSNRGRKPVVLEALRLLPPLSEGLELVGALIAPDPDRPVARIGTSRRFPPDPAEVGGTHPFDGAVIGPGTSEGASGRGTAILVGLRLTRPGVFGFDRMEIDYRADGVPYTMRVDLGFVGCGPPARYADRCPEAPPVDTDG
jgi:hypothetical protein